MGEGEINILGVQKANGKTRWLHEGNTREDMWHVSENKNHLKECWRTGEQGCEAVNTLSFSDVYKN